MEVFSAPVAPTIAMFSPASTVKETFFNTKFSHHKQTKPRQTQCHPAWSAIFVLCSASYHYCQKLENAITCHHAHLKCIEFIPASWSGETSGCILMNDMIIPTEIYLQHFRAPYTPVTPEPCRDNFIHRKKMEYTKCFWCSRRVISVDSLNFFISVFTCKDLYQLIRNMLLQEGFNLAPGSNIRDDFGFLLWKLAAITAAQDRKGDQCIATKNRTHK